MRHASLVCRLELVSFRHDGVLGAERRLCLRNRYSWHVYSVRRVSNWFSAIDALATSASASLGHGVVPAQDEACRIADDQAACLWWMEACTGLTWLQPSAIHVRSHVALHGAVMRHIAGVVGHLPGPCGRLGCARLLSTQLQATAHVGGSHDDPPVDWHLRAFRGALVLELRQVRRLEGMRKRYRCLRGRVRIPVLQLGEVDPWLHVRCAFLVHAVLNGLARCSCLDHELEVGVTGRDAFEAHVSLLSRALGGMRVREVRRQPARGQAAQLSTRGAVRRDLALLVSHQGMPILIHHLIAQVDKLERRVLLVPQVLVAAVRSRRDTVLVAPLIIGDHVFDAHELLGVLRSPSALVLDERVRLAGLLDVWSFPLDDTLDGASRVQVCLCRSICGQVAQ